MTLFDFRHLYSHNFSRQPHSRWSHFRRPFVTAFWTTLWLILPNWSLLTTEPTNQRTAKKIDRRSSLVYHITGYFPWLSFPELTINFWILVFCILHLLYKIKRRSVHYVTAVQLLFCKVLFLDFFKTGFSCSSPQSLPSFISLEFRWLIHTMVQTQPQFLRNAVLFYQREDIHWIYSLNIYQIEIVGGARGVMVIVAGNGHGDTSSNPGRDWLHFT